MQPSDIACSKCAAQPHEMCFDFYKWDNQTQSNVKNYRTEFHEERTFDAGTSGAVSVDKAIIDRAVEDLI